MRMPSSRTPDRPSSSQDRLFLYVRSYLLTRLVIGLVGVLLPAAVVTADLLLGGEGLRGSLSDYYHSGARDLFVGSLCVIGLFLVTYMLLLWNWDNVLSIGAGLAALGVALLPTAGDGPLTPVQEVLGERAVQAVHFVCAGVFIVLLGVLSFRFGTREGARPDRTARSGRWWRRFHRTCAYVVFAAVAVMAVTQATGRYDTYSLLVGETVAVLAFGLSWLVKGAELDLLLDRRRARRAGPPVV
jgi:hypothetical protein